MNNSGATAAALGRAQAAARDVREAADSCKVSALRDEGHSIAQKAQDVLSKIEERARSASGNHVAQAVEGAAQLAFQALAQAQGRLVTASREYKGGFFSKVKASLDTSHKKSFKEAHEKLEQALRSLDSSLDIAHSDQGAAAVAASSANQLQLQQGGLNGDMQLHLRWDRGNTVQSVGLITTGLAGGKPNLWVGLKTSTEFFPGCSSARKESEAIEKGKAMTCMFCTADSRCVWTGHADGTIMLHADGNWRVAHYSTQVKLPIRALTTDARLNCWAGDEAGIIYMLHHDRSSATIVLRKVDVPPASANIWQQSAARSGHSSNSSSSQGATGAPVTALLAKGPVIVSSGGHDRNYLTLWNSQKCEMVEHCNTQTYGPAHALSAVSWQEQMPVGAAAFAGAVVMTNDLEGWRLLSGHESGQLLLWQVHGLSARHGMRAIQLLCIIMDPRQLSPISHISCCEDFDMLVLADTSGCLTITAAPTADKLKELAAKALPSAIPGAPAPSRWTPKSARIKAHKSGIVAAASVEELFVTASTTTVKSWTADQLKLEAQGDGLMFTRRSRALTQSSSSQAHSAANAAAAGAVAATQQQQLQPILQQRLSGHSGFSGAETDFSHMSNLSHDNMGSGGSGRSGAAAVDSTSGGQRQQQQLAHSAAGEAAAPGAAAPAPVDEGPVAVRVQSAGRFVAASASKPNPLSRAAVEAKGMVVGPNNRVVPAALANLPQHQAFAVMQQVAPVMEMLFAPQWQQPVLLPGVPMQQQGGRSQGSGQLAPQTSAKQQTGGLVETSSYKPTDAIKADLVITAQELELNVPIGVGAEGKVYRGKWCGIDIAAKEYLGGDEDSDMQGSGEQSEAGRQRAQNALLKEVGILAKLSLHPNLVRFCGVCLDPPLVVMDYCRNGSMFHMLEGARSAIMQGRPSKYINYLSWKRRLQMLHDAAAGMLFLHSRRYVHGDLRSPNLFVTENGRVKIGDFGFTKRLKRSKETIKVNRITHPRWVAPELLEANELSTASDVYSFGIIMYEVLTFKIPFEECTKALVAIKVIAQQVRPHIPSYDKLPPNTSRICLNSYISLMKECWAQDPKQRPSFARIVSRLKAMQHWFYACSNALRLASTASKLQNLRQSSSSKGGNTPLAVGSGTVPHQHQTEASAAAARGAVPKAVAAHGAAAAAAAGPTEAAAGVGHKHGQQQQQQLTDVVGADDEDQEEAPPPAPEPGAAAAAKAAAPKPNVEPSVQVSVVDGKPIVCIDMGDGKDPQAVEEQLFLEMQSLTLKRGEAVAQQAQFIIVGPDLPQRALSTISEAAQPSQQSSRPGPAVAQLTGNNTDSGAGSGMEVQIPAASDQPDDAAAGPSQPPAVREGLDLQSRGAAGSATTSSRGLTAAAAAAGVAAGAAGTAVALGHPNASPAIKGSSATTVESSSAGKIDAFVRDASQTATHDKVKDWLIAGTGSSELSPAVQQQLHEQRLQVQAAAAVQQQEQAARAAAAAAARRRQEESDVCTAQDSPFFTLLPPCVSSGSVELGPFKRGAGSSHQGVMQQGGFGGGMPSFIDPTALDDSTLPATDGLGGGLSEAPTIYYPDDCSPAEALAMSAASIRSSSVTSSAPTMWNMAGPLAASGGGPAGAGGAKSTSSGGSQQQAPRGRLPGSSDSNPYSFTATEHSPFACLPVSRDDDDPLPAADDAAAAAAGAGGGSRRDLPHVDSNVISCGPFGRMPAIDEAAAGNNGTQLGAIDSLDLAAGPFGKQAAVGVATAAAAGGAGAAAAAAAGTGLDSQQNDSVVRDMGPFGKAVGPALGSADDSVVRDIGPFGHMIGQGLDASGAGEDSVVREPGPFGHLMGPALGAPGVNEDSIAPPLPLSPRQGAAAGAAGLGLVGLADPAAAAAAGPKASPPPSPKPESSATSATGSGGVPYPYGQPGPGQYGQPGPGQYGQPGPGPYGQPGPGQYPQGGPGHFGTFGPGQYGQPVLQGQYVPASPKGYPGAHFGPKGVAAAVSRISGSPRQASPAPGHAAFTAAAAAGTDAHGRRWSNSSKASSVAGSAVTAAVAAAGGGGGHGHQEGAVVDSSGAGVLHKPLDDSVLNKNLRVALGRQPTSDGDIDVVDAQQRDFEAFQNRASNAGGGGARRSSGSTAGAAGPAWAGPAGSGFLAPEGVKGWVPAMMPPPDAAMHQGGPDGAAAGPMPMPGWAPDGILPYGVANGARGRVPSGVDSTGGLSGWSGTGTSPTAAPGMCGYPNVGSVQAAAYMQMQAAAAAGAAAQGAGNWFPQMHNAGPHSMGQPGVGQQMMGQQMMSQQGMGQPGLMSSSPGMGQGMGQAGMGQQVMGPAGMGPQVMGQAGMGQQVTGQAGMGQQVMGQAGMGPQVMGQAGMGQQVMGQAGMGQPGMMSSSPNMGQLGMGQQMLGQPGMGQGMMSSSAGMGGYLQAQQMGDAARQQQQMLWQQQQYQQQQQQQYMHKQYQQHGPM